MALWIILNLDQGLFTLLDIFTAMEITKTQYNQIEHCMRRQRSIVSLSNWQVLNAILCVADHCCNSVDCQNA